MVITQVRPDGSEIPYLPEQLFDVSITEGEEFGTLLSAIGDTATSFTGVPQPIRFIEGYYLGVHSTITAVPSEPPSPKVQRSPAKTRSDRIKTVLASLQQAGGFECLTPQATASSHMDILLGETKYVRAVYSLDGSRLLIQEVPMGPTLNQIAENAWGADPVSRVSGPKIGVYWEKQDDKNNVLPKGYIRLVGRYWDSEHQYSVTLTASDGAQTFLDTVNVVKPSLLGNSSHLAPGIAGQCNIDSLCIAVGGKYGFPPQLLKAHISKEAVRFHPSYRYEPFTTQAEIQRRYGYWNANQGFVDESGNMGVVSIPNHANVLYFSYPTEPHTVWWYVQQYSGLEEVHPGGDLYGIRKSDGKMDFKSLGYTAVQKEYNNFLKRKQDLQGGLTPERIDSVRLEFIHHLKTKYHTGLDSNFAQTRIASSYGLLQRMFTLAVSEDNYPWGTDPNDSQWPPERLNDNSVFFDFAMKHYSDLLAEAVTNSSSDNNWSGGLDAGLHRTVALWNQNSGNGNQAYADDVFTRMHQLYWPAK